MAMSDDTNEFLRTNLVFENDLNPLFKCGLCNNIIVDCCITSCDCFFCRNCILKYFENKDIINCPTCKKENIGSNIKRNKSINNKIKLIRVKCSNSTCEEIDTISNMKNHIKECDKGKLSCPFINLGCNKSDINGNHEMKVHFSRNLVEHNEILINVLGTLDNDMKVMKEQICDLTNQNEEKSNKINELYMKVDGLTNKNRESENKLNNQEMKINELENKVDEMEVRDVNLRRELEEYKTNSRRFQDKIDEFEIRFDNLIRNTDEIKKDGEDAKIHVDHLSVDLATVKSEYEKQLQSMSGESKKSNLENETSENQIKEVSKRIDEVRNEMREEIEARYNNNKDNIIKLEKYLEDEKEKLWQEISLDNQFLWKIDELFEKKTEASEGRNIRKFSVPFYSHKFGYQMRIRIYPDGLGSYKGIGLSIYFVIMKGENDEILKWPCRRTIKLSLSNQDSFEDERVKSFQVDTVGDEWKEVFNKPTKSENIAFGYDIKWTDIINSPGLLKNGSLLIKCFTSS